MPKSAILLGLLLTLGGKFVLGQTDISAWKTIEKQHYSLSYPPEWLLDQSGQLETELFLLSPLDNASDDFQENINLVTQNVDEFGVDLSGYVELCFSQLRQLVTNFKVIDMDMIRDEGDEYYKLSFHADQGDFHLVLEQRYYVKNSEAYVLTLTCEEEEFEHYQVVGHQILDSFFVKP